jgi:hypothetical protein
MCNGERFVAGQAAAFDEQCAFSIGQRHRAAD